MHLLYVRCKCRDGSCTPRLHATNALYPESPTARHRILVRLLYALDPNSRKTAKHPTGIQPIVWSGCLLATHEGGDEGGKFQTYYSVYIHCCRLAVEERNSHQSLPRPKETHAPALGLPLLFPLFRRSVMIRGDPFFHALAFFSQEPWGKKASWSLLRCEPRQVYKGDQECDLHWGPPFLPSPIYTVHTQSDLRLSKQ